MIKMKEACEVTEQDKVEIGKRRQKKETVWQKEKIFFHCESGGRRLR